MCPANGTIFLTMNSVRFQLRRWAAGLAWLPLIGLALAPISLADPGSDDTGPCAWDAASMACAEWEAGGVSNVCGLQPLSMGCDQAQAAADGRGPVPPPSP